jgi:hypothetical protein
MATRSLVLVANKSLDGVIDDRLLWKTGSSINLAEKLEWLLRLTRPEKDKIISSLYTYFIKRQSLDLLCNRLFNKSKLAN